MTTIKLHHHEIAAILRENDNDRLALLLKERMEIDRREEAAAHLFRAYTIGKDFPSPETHKVFWIKQLREFSRGNEEFLALFPDKSIHHHSPDVLTLTAAKVFFEKWLEF